MTESQGIEPPERDVLSEAYGAWMRDPAAWWEAEQRASPVSASGQSLRSDLGAFGQWFPGCDVNTCSTALIARSRRAGQPARAIWDSPMTGQIKTFTYADLLARTEKLAGALAALGVTVATGSSSICRWSPRLPRDARHRPFGLVHTPLCLAASQRGTIHTYCRRPLRSDHLGSCGLEPEGVQYKPAVGRGNRDVTTAGCCLIRQRPQAEPLWSLAEITTSRQRSPRHAASCVPCWQPIRF